MMKIKPKFKIILIFESGIFGLHTFPANADLGMDTFSIRCFRSQIALFNSPTNPEAL